MTATMPQVHQSLLDNLQSAADRAQEQATHLQMSMEEVKKLQIKLQGEHSEGTLLLDEAYVRHIIAAWHSTTTSWATVFHELCKVAKPSAETQGHTKINHRMIRQVYKTTVAARNAVHMANPHPHTSQQPHTASNSRKRAAGPDYDSSEPRRMKRTHDSTPLIHGTKRVATDDTEISERQRTPKMQRTQSFEPLSQHHESAHKSSTRPLDNHSTTPTSSNFTDDIDDTEMIDSGGEPADTGDDIYIPPVFGVRYVDVTAEVEERLKLKELRRLDKKGDMKRKRPTRDLLNPKIFAIEQEQERARMPPSKRTKKASFSGPEHERTGSKRGASEVNDDGGLLKRRKS